MIGLNESEERDQTRGFGLGYSLSLFFLFFLSKFLVTRSPCLHSFLSISSPFLPIVNGQNSGSDPREGILHWFLNSPEEERRGRKENQKVPFFEELGSASQIIILLST